MFVVVAAFEVNPADWERFLAVANEDAIMSVEREPGCRQFDVCVDPAREGSILFYEVYDDAAAFEEHKRTDHFKTFDEGSRPLIVRSDVRFLDRICPR
jgi:(4S)-4-hydroxy-5-phosphonooxypentane-2,3-dione isomerase